VATGDDRRFVRRPPGIVFDDDFAAVKCDPSHPLSEELRDLQIRIDHWIDRTHIAAVAPGHAIDLQRLRFEFTWNWAAVVGYGTPMSASRRPGPQPDEPGGRCPIPPFLEHLKAASNSCLVAATRHPACTARRSC